MVDSGTFRTSSYLQEVQYLKRNQSGVLLSNTDKGPGTVRRHIDPSSDLSKLDICFGGFSPTAIGDLEVTRAQAERAEQRARERKEAAERAAAVEAAQASDEKEHRDGRWTWRYVVLNGCEVRIERCVDSVEGADDGKGAGQAGVAAGGETGGVAEHAPQELHIPDTIDGMPVVALAADACSKLQSIQRITMADSIVKIGFCAFRDCPNLQSIEFSAQLASYDAGWLRGCSKVQHIKLPGKLDKITSSVFDMPALTSLVLGSAAAEVMPGAFAKSNLETISVSGDNPHLATDGTALYTHDKAVLIALAVPVRSYDVAAECVAIARKGFSTFAQLESVKLPDGLELIGDYAFTKTAVTEFMAPPSLKIIGERAFFACPNLAQVTLNEGLMAIGSNAFSDTALHELSVPSTIVDLGNPLATGTDLTYSGADATFKIRRTDDGSQQLTLDADGGLYRNAEDGMHLVRMMEPAAVVYAVAPGTVAIDDGAFAKHKAIEFVTLPDGLTKIGAGAFRDCRQLTHINVPESLTQIGDEAFLDTNLEQLRIPAALTRIGAVSLITYGAHHGTTEPALRHIEVDAANPKYFMESGLLIEHMDNGKDRVILCTGEVEDVVIPGGVTAIASYAFNGVRRLRSLTVHERVQAIDVRGIAFDSLVDVIHVDLEQPVEGHTAFDFRFPKTERAAQQMGHAFGSCNFINVSDIFNHYDNAIVNRNGFDAGGGSQLDVYDQVTRLIERLKDPIFMTPTNRGLMESALRSHLHAFCLEIAKHDDKAAIDGLLDLGFLDKDNIGDVIEAVGAVQDASITNYLLEQKQRRFGTSTIDFEL